MNIIIIFCILFGFAAQKPTTIPFKDRYGTRAGSITINGNRGAITNKKGQKMGGLRQQQGSLQPYKIRQDKK